MPFKPLPGPPDHDPARLEAPLERLMKRLGAAGANTEQSVFDAWPDLVGEKVASQAHPSSLRDGVLKVVVTDPAWATQLRFLEAELIARIGARFGADEVTRVEISVRTGVPGHLRRN